VQAVSGFRKRVSRGLRCETARSAEADVASGWQLDTEDPYRCCGVFPVLSFSLIGTPGIGSDFTVGVEDYPGRPVTELPDYDFSDSLYVDDRFEMYVLYFTGPDPTHPPIQRPLGKLSWNWGGLVVFDWNANLHDGFHTIRYTNAPPSGRSGQIFEPAMQNMNSLVTMHGNVRPPGGDRPSDVRCPGGPPLTDNPIDSSRQFVKYHYLDFLRRDPNGVNGDPHQPPDLPGWNYWTSNISQCVFDFNCIHMQRINTGLAFFYSSEFVGTDPDMANPPGSPGFNPAVYNRAFVKYCYIYYLGRNPMDDIEGWNFWTNDLNSNGDYFHMIDAFQVSSEYRDGRIHR